MFLDAPIGESGQLIANQQGEFLSAMQGCRFDPGVLRPFTDRDGQKYVTINTGQKYDEDKKDFVPLYRKVPVNEMIANGMGSPVHNATLALRKDEWIQMDQVVVRAARQRLRAWADLAAANSYGGFNGMGKMILEHETMSDPGEALVDMDGLTEGRTDAPKFQLEGLPLPITHSDFWFSSRRLAISRNSGMPLDTSMGESAARRVAETIEKTVIGIQSGISYGSGADYSTTPKVHGYLTHPDRNVKADMNAPTGSNGPTVLSDWLALRDTLYAANMYGPYMAYVSSDYDQYLDNLFSTSEPSAGTLRTRLLEIDGIQGIRRLDFLSDTATVILVQMTADVARAINGMDITTVQWESHGGMRLNFKVMAIQVPQIRSDFNGNCGVAVGTTS